MKHGSKMTFSYLLLSLPLTLCFFTVNVKSDATQLKADETSLPHDVPEGKQGILEIPKQAATIIRNFIDRNLHNYLNVPTPAPQNSVPGELSNSIVGNFLLGNFYSTRPPAPAYKPELPAQLTQIQPILASAQEPTFIAPTQHVEPTTVPPTPPPSPPAPLPQIQTETQTQESIIKQRVKPEKVHVLDMDTSLSGIFNSNDLLGGNAGVISASQSQVVTTANVPPIPSQQAATQSQGFPNEPTPSKVSPYKPIQPQPPPYKPKIKPNQPSPSDKVPLLETDTSLSGIYNAYGVLVSNNPDDEVYWIPDATRPSIVIPIVEASTSPRPKPTTEPTTEAPAEVETTTEEDEEEGLLVSEERLKKIY